MKPFQKTVSARVYRSFLAHAERNGCDPEAICRAADLDEDFLENPYSRVTGDRHLSLLRMAAEWSIPCAPMSGGIAGWLRPFPEVAGVVCNCPTLGNALQRFAHYRDIIGNVDWVTINESDDLIMIDYTLEDNERFSGSALGNFALIVDLARLYDPAVTVCGAELSGAPLHAYKAWSDVLGARVESHQPHNRLVLRSKALRTPFLQYNAALASIHLEAATQVRDKIRCRGSFTEEVKLHLRKWLREASDDLSQEWMRQRLCEQLRISRWTLQRRLQAEKVQFGHLLNLARVHEAIHLLTHTQLPIGEIAGRLHFGSTSAFTHFFVRTYGTSPMQYRTTNRLSTELQTNRLR